MIRISWCVPFLVVCLAFSACNRGRPEPKRYPVSGTVTLDGQPLAEGLITFKTIATGAIESIDIKDGKFAGRAEPGDRRVEVYFFRMKTQDIDGMKTEIKENVIPARYNTESTLTKNVAPDGPNQFTFELLSK